jgi:hypothetical protein
MKPHDQIRITETLVISVFHLSVQNFKRQNVRNHEILLGSERDSQFMDDDTPQYVINI